MSNVNCLKKTTTTIFWHLYYMSSCHNFINIKFLPSYSLNKHNMCANTMYSKLICLLTEPCKKLCPHSSGSLSTTLASCNSAHLIKITHLNLQSAKWSHSFWASPSIPTLPLSLILWHCLTVYSPNFHGFCGCQITHCLCPQTLSYPSTSVNAQLCCLSNQNSRLTFSSNT